jgi:SAM-dependent methyltransferase
MCGRNGCGILAFDLRKNLGNYLRRLRYGGNSRWCPICHSGARAFLSYGKHSRPNEKCPFCGSLGRHRLLWLYLERRTDFFANPPSRMLHVAPERMLKPRFRKLLGKDYMTADLGAEDVDVRMDVADIQFPNDHFDFIYCSHVLEHVLDDRQAMREFRRVLSGDGLAILLVPITAERTFEDSSITDPAERARHFGQWNHVRRYGPDYADRLRGEQFDVEVVAREDFLNPKEIGRMGVANGRGEIHVCRKSSRTSVA